MPYSIDPQNSASPTDANEVGYAAAEFRALKAWLQASIKTPLLAMQAVLAANSLPINYLQATGTRDATTFLRGDGSWQALAGAVTSFKGRSGAVVPVADDYTVAQVTGAAPLANPALTGTGATIDGVRIGYLGVPVVLSVAAVTAGPSHKGRIVSGTFGVTVNTGVFGAGDAFMVFNDGTGTLTLTKGSGLVMRKVGTSGNANVVVAAYGMAHVLFLSSSYCVVSGVGLT